MTHNIIIVMIENNRWAVKYKQIFLKEDRELCLKTQLSAAQVNNRNFRTQQYANEFLIDGSKVQVFRPSHNQKIGAL